MLVERMHTMANGWVRRQNFSKFYSLWRIETPPTPLEKANDRTQRADLPMPAKIGKGGPSQSPPTNGDLGLLEATWQILFLSQFPYHSLSSYSYPYQAKKKILFVLFALSPPTLLRLISKSKQSRTPHFHLAALQLIAVLTRLSS